MKHRKDAWRKGYPELASWALLLHLLRLLRHVIHSAVGHECLRYEKSGAFLPSCTSLGYGGCVCALLVVVSHNEYVCTNIPNVFSAMRVPSQTQIQSLESVGIFGRRPWKTRINVSRKHQDTVSLQLNFAGRFSVTFSAVGQACTRL